MHLFPTLLDGALLKLAIVGVFTPWKLANATKLGFPSEGWLWSIYQQATAPSLWHSEATQEPFVRTMLSAFLRQKIRAGHGSRVKGHCILALWPHSGHSPSQAEGHKAKWQGPRVTSLHIPWVEKAWEQRKSRKKEMEDVEWRFRRLGGKWPHVNAYHRLPRHNRPEGGYYHSPFMDKKTEAQLSGDLPQIPQLAGDKARSEAGPCGGSRWERKDGRKEGCLRSCSPPLWVPPDRPQVLFLCSFRVVFTTASPLLLLPLT